MISKLWIKIFSVLIVSCILNISMAQEDICKKPNRAQRLIRSARAALDNFLRPLPQKRFSDLNQAMEDPEFVQKVLTELKKWSQGDLKIDSKARFQMDLSELMPQIEREKERMLHHLQTLQKILAKDARQVLDDATLSGYKRALIQEVYIDYKKTLTKVLKQKKMTYDDYLKLMVYHQAVQSYETKHTINPFNNVFLALENARKAQRNMAPHAILVVPTYDTFNPKELNQLLGKDHTIMGMSYKLENYDGLKDRAPLPYMEHDMAHINIDLDFFLNSFSKLKIDRKIFFNILFKKMDLVDGSELQRDLHLILLTFTHETQAQVPLNLEDFSANFKNSLLVQYLPEVIQERLKIMDQLWSESLQEARALAASE